jgi:putative spermidine/putrescine transport system permease protein
MSSRGPVDRRSANMKPWELLALGLALLFLSFYLPVALLIGTDADSIFGVMSAVVAYLSDALFWDSLLVTMQIGIATTVCCLLLAAPVAIFISHSGYRLERALATLVLASLFTSILLRSFVWFVLLGRNGPLAEAVRSLFPGATAGLLFSRFAVVLGMTHILLPMATIILWSRMRILSRWHYALSSQLGASFAFYVLRISLPANARVIAATSLLIFVMSIGFYVTPLLLGGGSGETMMVGVLIDEQINRFGNWSNGAALSLLLVVLLLVVGLSGWAGARAIARSVRA